MMRSAFEDNRYHVDSLDNDEVAAKLAAAREQIALGEAAQLKPLDELLREARGRR